MKNLEKLAFIVVLAIAVKIASIIFNGIGELYRFEAHGIRAPTGVYNPYVIGNSGYYILVLFSITLLLALLVGFGKNTLNFVRVMGASITTILIPSIFLSYMLLGGKDKPSGFEGYAVLLGSIFLLATFVSKDWYPKILTSLGSVFVFVGIISLLALWLVSTISLSGKFEKLWLSIIYGFVLTFGLSNLKGKISPRTKVVGSFGILMAIGILYHGRVLQ